MQKKAGAKKKTSIKKASHTKPKTIVKGTNVEKVLVQNFIALQKVMTNLAIKFDSLGAQISKLLELFEISAKSLAEKDITLGKTQQGEGKMVEKLDELLDQNKVIAKGLTLLHESPEPISPPQLMRQPSPQAPPQPRPFKTSSMALQPPPQKTDAEKGYQRSIQIKDQRTPNPRPAREERRYR